MTQQSTFIRQPQADDDKYDIELDLSDGAGDNMITPHAIDDEATAAAVEAEEGRRSAMAKLACVCAFTAVTVVGTGAIIGTSISGAAEYKRQQNAVAVSNAVDATHSGKSGKSASFCETSPVLTCGTTVLDTEITLSDNLLCLDSSSGAAIKLEGPNARIDCNGYTVRNVLEGSYESGILLIDGAMAINCNVEQFNIGFIVEDGGEVKKSEASHNQIGVLVEHNIAGSVATKISDVYVHGNGDGIVVEVAYTRFEGDEYDVTIEDVTTLDFDLDNDADNLPEDVLEDLSENGVSIEEVESLELMLPARDNQDPDTIMEPSTATAGAGVVIEDVTSKFNLESGMKLQGPGITVKDSTSSYNKKYGITMIGSFIFLPTLVQYEGSVSSHHNEKHGILVAGSFKATVVNVMGALNTYLNNGSGLLIFATGLLFYVEKYGAFNACQNADYDVKNIKSIAVFLDDEDGYTCDTTKKSGFFAKGLPQCISCPCCD